MRPKIVQASAGQRSDVSKTKSIMDYMGVTAIAIMLLSAFVGPIVYIVYEAFDQAGMPMKHVIVPIRTLQPSTRLTHYVTVRINQQTVSIPITGRHRIGDKLNVSYRIGKSGHCYVLGASPVP